MYNSCTTYEMSKSPECTAKSLKISQLKSQLIQLEEMIEHTMNFSKNIDNSKMNISY